MKKYIFALSALMATQAFANVLDDCMQSPTIKTCTQAVKVSSDASYKYLLSKAYASNGNQKDMMKWLQKSAEQGFGPAQFDLGLAYTKGDGVKPSPSEALKWFHKVAEQGNVSAQVNVALIYSFQESYHKAIKWYRTAAEQGSSQAQVNLGKMYIEGKGVKRSYSEALKWFRKAAAQGNLDGIKSLSLMYFRGWGVKQSYSEAFKILDPIKKMAEQGNPELQFTLASLYYMTPNDKLKNAEKNAIKWLTKTASQGNYVSATLLSLLYFDKGTNYILGLQKKMQEDFNKTNTFSGRSNLNINFDSVSDLKIKDLKNKNLVKAFQYAKLASNKNSPFRESALNILGIMYMHGLGVNKSTIEAKKYFNMAAKLGNVDALKQLEAIK